MVRIFLLLVVLAASPSSADDPEARAKALALEGKQAFDIGDYGVAIERYEAAYQLKAAPGLLFNLGQCHRKAGRFDEALSFFRRYLESNPPPEQAKATEQIIAEFEAQRAEKLAEAAAEAERKRKADELRVTAARAEAEAAARKLQLELSRRQAEAPPPVTQRWYFWAGIAAVVVGGVVAGTAAATAPRPTPTTFPDINAR